MKKLLPALLALTPLLLAGDCTSPTVDDDDTTEQQSDWAVMDEGLPGALISIWGSSSSDVWVAGAHEPTGLRGGLRIDGPRLRQLQLGQYLDHAASLHHLQRSHQGEVGGQHLGQAVGQGGFVGVVGEAGDGDDRHLLPGVGRERHEDGEQRQPGDEPDPEPAERGAPPVGGVCGDFRGHRSLRRRVYRARPTVVPERGREPLVR